MWDFSSPAFRSGRVGKSGVKVRDMPIRSQPMVSFYSILTHIVYLLPFLS